MTTLLNKDMPLKMGDLCPHCRLIIMMPPEYQPECISCGGKLFDDDYYPDEH